MAQCDVVVVGAGLSGLAAAQHIATSPTAPSVVVVEAQDRVGGRLLTEEGWDLGGMWIGPSQSHLQALCKRLGIALHDQFVEGRKVLHAHSRVMTYSGLVPPLNPWTSIELQLFFMNRVERLCRQVPVHAPWLAPNAVELDNQTVGAWAASRLYTTAALQLVDIATCMVFGKHAHQISMLHFLHYCHAAGGLVELLETRGHAQHATMVGGAQQLCERLREEVEQSGGSVVLGAPCVEVRAHDSGVEVRTGNGKVITAKHVIIAVAPSVVRRIKFDPPLSPARVRMCKATTSGCYTKIIATYATAFWREKGLSGECLNLAPCPAHPIAAVYDHSLNGASALVVFVAGEVATVLASLSAEERQKRVLAHLAELVGDARALSPLKVREKQWQQDEFSGGCPVDTFPSATFLRHASLLRQREHQRILWAATETATQWPGYMDGAIQAGVRAAQEALSPADDAQDDSVEPLFFSPPLPLAAKPGCWCLRAGWWVVGGAVVLGLWKAGHGWRLPVW